MICAVRLDGISAVSSELTQRPYRARTCEFLIEVNSNNKAEALKNFRKLYKDLRCQGLRLNSVKDAGFLAEFPNLLFLEVIGQKRFDTRQLDDLANLRGLRLETPGAGLDFACFPELERFIGDWHIDNHNLHRAGELRAIHAWQFKPRSGDLADLANCTRLERLNIVKSDIKSLAGLETLEDLRYLNLAYVPKLESLEACTANEVDLREFEIEKAKGIASYLPLASIRRLRRLKLSGCAPMSDLKWTKGMNYLDFFSLVETNVEDGDLSPLLKLPKLRYVGTMDKRHYNYKFEELNELLNSGNE